jgi:hypothetical protein
MDEKDSLRQNRRQGLCASRVGSRLTTSPTARSGCWPWRRKCEVTPVTPTRRGFIATLAIPPGQFQIEQTGRRGHYTLWGSPDVILGHVTHVVPTRNEEEPR